MSTICETTQLPPVEHHRAFVLAPTPARRFDLGSDIGLTQGQTSFDLGSNVFIADAALTEVF